MVTPNDLRGPDPLVEVGVGLEGYFEVELVDAHTGVVKRHLEFHNVITDAGMNAIGDGTGNIADLQLYLAVGTGTSTPAQSDTSLDTEVARTSRSSASSSSGPNFDFTTHINEYEFGKSEANGNLTELGCFDSSSAGVMYTRQRFKDAQGNNTTVTKTSDDILRVRYAHRLYPDKTVKTKNIDVDVRGSLVSTTFSYQPQEIDDGGVWLAGGTNGLGQHFGTWSGQSPDWWEDNTPPGDFISHGPLDPSVGERAGTVTFNTYGTGNFYRDVVLSAGASEANFAAGVGSVAWTPLDSTQTTNEDQGFLLLFDPRIDKTSQDQVELTVRLSWSRVAV